MLDPQLRDSFLNGTSIAWIAADDAFNPGLKNALALRSRRPLGQRASSSVRRTETAMLV